MKKITQTKTGAEFFELRQGKELIESAIADESKGHGGHLPTGFDAWTERVVAIMSWSLIGRHGFTESDFHDLAQDFRLALWIGLPKAVGVNIKAATYRILASSAVDMVRRRRCKCRDWSKEAFSLDQSDPDEGNGVPLRDSLDLQAMTEASVRTVPAWFLRWAEAMDMRRWVTDLPDDLRALAMELEAEGGDLTAAARRLGLSRKKARRMRADLHRRLSADGWARRHGGKRNGMGMTQNHTVPRSTVPRSTVATMRQEIRAMKSKAPLLASQWAEFRTRYLPALAVPEEVGLKLVRIAGTAERNCTCLAARASSGLAALDAGDLKAGANALCVCRWISADCKALDKAAAKLLQEMDD